MVRYFLVLLLILIPATALSADVEVTASSCSSSNIKAMISAALASNTTTIHVPTGTCTWDSSVTIPSDKTIKLKGGGSGASGTVITLTGGYQLISNSANSEITGFRFLHATGSTAYTITIRNIGWRIHDIYFGHATPEAKGTTNGIYPTGDTDGVSGRHPAGLIDNNTFDNHRIVVYGETTTNLTDPSVIWAADNVWGTYADTVYVENNLFINRSSGNVMDSNSASKYVFRFNTITDGANVMAHSLQGANIRGSKTWEIYNNNFDFTTGVSSIAFLRSGTGFVYNNTATFASAYYSSIANVYFDNVRSVTAYGVNPSSGKCDGTSNWDGNVSGQQGWPCRDHIGRGKDTGTDESAIGKATSSEPAYLWNNYNATGSKNIPVAVASGSAVHIQANRDYYDYNASNDGISGVGYGLKSAMPATCTKSTDANGGPGYWATDENKLYRCTDTNTWTLQYTPYICPHPLADPSAQGECDYTKYGQDGYALTGGESDETAPTVTSVYVNGATMTINFSEAITSAADAAFTLDPSGADVTVDCPAVTTGATSMACTISRAIVQSETAKYAYTDTKVVDAATNPLANIGATDITGNLTPAEAPTSKLTVNKTGAGCTVTSSPSGISLSGATASDDFDFNTNTAVTLSGYSENGWNAITYGGDCASNGTVTMNAAKECTATCTQVYLFP